MASLLGRWTYRSFVNDPDPVTSAAEAQALIFGEGLLTVTRADTAGRLLRVDANGAGHPQSPVADFRYDCASFEVSRKGATASTITVRQDVPISN